METTQALNTVILKAMGSRQRARDITDLKRLFKTVREADTSIEYKEFLGTFKTLQRQGAGRLIIGRGSNVDRFAWNYNMREVAKAKLQGAPLSEVKPLKGVQAVVASQSAREVLKVSTGPTLQLTIQLPASTPAHDIKALLELVESLKEEV